MVSFVLRSNNANPILTLSVRCPKCLQSILLTILTLVRADAVLVREHSHECVLASGDGAALDYSHASCVHTPLFLGEGSLENGVSV